MELTLIDVLLLLAPLVLVPVGLVARDGAGVRRADVLRLVAAALVAPSLLAHTGGPAGALASALAQIAGALLLSIGVWIVAGLTAVVVAPRTAGAGARALFYVSACGVVAPMVLAVFWAAGQHFDVPALDVPAVARIHGTLNAFAFSLAGLLGLVARDREPAVRRSVAP